MVRKWQDVWRSWEKVPEKIGKCQKFEISGIQFAEKFEISFFISFFQSTLARDRIEKTREQVQVPVLSCAIWTWPSCAAYLASRFESGNLQVRKSNLGPSENSTNSDLNGICIVLGGSQISDGQFSAKSNREDQRRHFREGALKKLKISGFLRQQFRSHTINKSLFHESTLYENILLTWMA